jgi:hypothetical protein
MKKRRRRRRGRKVYKMKTESESESQVEQRLLSPFLRKKFSFPTLSSRS